VNKDVGDVTHMLDYVHIKKIEESNLDGSLTYTYGTRPAAPIYEAAFFKDKPSCIDAFFTYMLSGYFKERKNTNTYTKFGIEMNGYEPYYFYSLKNYTGNLPENTVVDTNVLQASIYWLNQRVSSMRSQDLSGMTALSRVTFSEQNIADIASLFHVTIDSAVKFCNTSMVRKPYQFGVDYPFYDPELSAAALIMGVMSSNPSAPLLKITRKIVGKIAKMAINFNNDKVIGLMQHVTGRVGELPVDEIFDRFKK
jgi:hypothetical protein